VSIFEGSRYSFVEGRKDSAGRLFLTDREPYRFVALADNIVHVVAQGDTLWGIAGRYYEGIARPAGYWWAIADFQPNPIHDPTIALVAGSVIIVPSLRTLLEDVIGEKRRTELGG
jgi:nucleoid-associated protein YgaU